MTTTPTTTTQTTKKSRKFRSARLLTLEEFERIKDWNVCIPTAARKLRVRIDSFRRHYKTFMKKLGWKKWPRTQPEDDNDAFDNSSDEDKPLPPPQPSPIKQTTKKSQPSVTIDRSQYGVQEYGYISIKQEDEENGTNNLIVYKQPMEFPTFDSEKIYDKCIKRKEHPFISHECQIEFLPSFENTEFETHLGCAELKSDDSCTLSYSEMNKLLRYRDAKVLERCIKDRMLGRVSNGFRKTVNSMPITQCQKDVFEYYFGYYGAYCERKERNLPGYDRIGDFKKAIGTSYIFKYPYLPTFGDRFWTLNEYSIYNDEDIEEEEIDVQNLPECYRKLMEEIKEHESFEQGWNHLRNMVYRLTITHNSITDMVSVSFGMVSLRLQPDMKYQQTL